MDKHLIRFFKPVFVGVLFGIIKELFYFRQMGCDNFIPLFAPSFKELFRLSGHFQMFDLGHFFHYRTV